MRLSNNEIILFSMLIATAVMFLIGRIQNALRSFYYAKGIKRTKYIEQLVKDDVIPFTLINVDMEPTRLEQPDNNIGIIVDKVLYNEKNAYFLSRNGRIHIIGKKEDFMITLVGRNIGD